MSKEKNTKAFAQAKRNRRQWLTFIRMCRYGINNFTRNAWLSIAATAIMTITLLILLVTAGAQNILNDTSLNVKKNLDRSIYLKTGTTESQARPIMDDLKNISNVDSVSFLSSDQGKDDYAKKNKTDRDTLEAIKEATNKIPATIRINLTDPTDTKALIDFVNNNQNLKKYIDTTQPPSFVGERKSTIDTIAGWTLTAQEIGIGASLVFTALSMLIIFNTIRMAIFNRRDEIEMMKLIGADKGFIRGPFVVEAIVYGFIAAVVATALGFVVMLVLQDKVANWGIVIEPTITLYTRYVGLILLIMIIIGGIVGTISSLLATRRYLKI